MNDRDRSLTTEETLIVNMSIHDKQRLNGVELDADETLALEDALEKQIERKVALWNGQDKCPRCNMLFGPRDIRKSLISWKMDYCKYCGQRLDWSGCDGI